MTKALFLPTLTHVDGIEAGFSTDAGGDDPSAMSRAAGFDPSRLFTLKQVHGTKVLEITPDRAPDEVRTEEGDAMICVSPGQTLAIQTADCVPVLFAATSGARPVVGAAHAGWRGLAAGVLAQTAAAVAEAGGVSSKELHASVGPAIGPCCFEVSAEVAQEIAHGVGTSSIIIDRHPRPYVDLPRAAQLALERAGLREDQIEHVDLCTRCEADLLHSYRRSGARAGRQLSFVVIRER